ncbi:hypothetical protein ACFY97_27065 [Streptomyces klenkii]|uniref:hypothetical protein n=1 Tax=Streptomyces klenkii TaxID=1420899 RepID=UPI0036E654F8
MVAVALLLPPLMLCVVLALGRYEERMLSGPATERPEQTRRLRAVPDLTGEEPGSRQEPVPPAGRAPSAGPFARGRGRHAA